MLILATVVCSPPPPQPSCEQGEILSLMGYVTSFTPTRSMATWRVSELPWTSGMPADFVFIPPTAALECVPLDECAGTFTDTEDLPVKVVKREPFRKRL